MEGASYSCCRCGLALQGNYPREPWPCRAGCGEWLSREAVDDLHLPALLTPIRIQASAAAPRCILCGASMRALPGAPYYLCVKHGIWFDAGMREFFTRLLSEEMDKHWKARAPGGSAPPLLQKPSRP